MKPGRAWHCISQMRKQQTHITDPLCCSQETRNLYQKLNASRHGFVLWAEISRDGDGMLMTDWRKVAAALQCIPERGQRNGWNAISTANDGVLLPRLGRKRHLTAQNYQCSWWRWYCWPRLNRKLLRWSCVTRVLLRFSLDCLPNPRCSCIEVGVLDRFQNGTGLNHGCSQELSAVYTFLCWWNCSRRIIDSTMLTTFRMMIAFLTFLSVLVRSFSSCRAPCYSTTDRTAFFFLHFNKKRRIFAKTNLR